MVLKCGGNVPEYFLDSISQNSGDLEIEHSKTTKCQSNILDFPQIMQ